MNIIIFFVILLILVLGIIIIVVIDRNKKTQPEIKKPTRRCVKDVKSGEFIWIEWDRIRGRIGQLKCVNNDPETKKILLEVRWRGVSEIEKVIFDYDDKELKNFHLLNKSDISSPQSDGDEEDFDIITLQKKMNEAIEKQEYEEADKLQKKIDKLSKKK